MSMAFAATTARPQAALIFKRFGALVMLTILAACSTVVPKGGQAPIDDNALVIPADGKHHVALLLPVTGADAEIGKSIANATALALTDTNSTNIVITTYDTATGVDAAARQAVAEGNRLILGPLRSDDVLAVANVARPAKIPVISFSNDVGVAGQNVFLLGHLPYQSIQRIVNYSKAAGLTRFGGVVAKNVYGQRASSDFTRAVYAAGGTLVAVKETDGSAASVAAATQDLAAAGIVDAVLIGDTGSGASVIVPALRKNGIKTARILGTDQWNLDGSLSSKAAMRGAWFASVSDVMYRQYAEKYRVRFGKAPARLSSLGYDSVLLVARVAQNWQLGAVFPTTRLTDPEGFIGVDGAFRFLANGLSERMLEVQEVQAGKFTTIDPAPRTFPK